MPRRKQNPQSLKQTVSTGIKKMVWRVEIYNRSHQDDGKEESTSDNNQGDILTNT